MLTVGDAFPKFKSHACVGASGGNFIDVTNDQFKGSWAVFFFYPKDFTFVCPTEIIEFNTKLGDFEKKGAKVVGGSTDNEYSHLAWCEQHPGLQGLKFPLIAAQKLAADLGIVHPSEGVCLRATFIVGPDGIIRWASANDLPVGRNIDEVLRVLDALQTGALTPCNWKPGQKTL